MHLSDHVLTPNHFLIGQMGGDFVPGSVDSEPFNPRKCWRRSTTRAHKDMGGTNG